MILFLLYILRSAVCTEVIINADFSLTGLASPVIIINLFNTTVRTEVVFI